MFTQIYPPLFFETILASTSTSLFSSKFSINSATFLTLFAFSNETSGFPPLFPVMMTSISSPGFTVIFPSLSVTSYAFKTPSVFLSTSTKISSPFIATTMPFVTPPPEVFSKDSSSIDSKSSNSSPIVF